MSMATPSISPSSAPALAGRFQALSDEKRLRILEVLSTGERCVCDVQADLRVSQSLLSFHLKVLKDAGLVSDRRDGRWVQYSLDTDALEDLAVRLEELARRGREAGGGDPCC